jgi:hypothetical protein
MRRAAKSRGLPIASPSLAKNNFQNFFAIFSIVCPGALDDRREPNSELQSICCIIVTSNRKNDVDGILGCSSRDERRGFVCSARIAAGHPDEIAQKNS